MKHEPTTPTCPKPAPAEHHITGVPRDRHNVGGFFGTVKILV
jgi:hypothetical protein